MIELDPDLTGGAEKTGDGERSGRGAPAPEPARERAPTTTEAGWRSRALEAEQRLAQLEPRLRELEAELEAAEAQVRIAERRQQIERELSEAQAVDLETATLLTEAAVEGMDAPDVGAVVSDLRRRKPFLFRADPQGPLGLSGGAEQPSGDRLAQEAADRARGSNDRRELLRYLRLRRGAS
ncbi:MAG: hypothetical protein AAGG07_08720 [Planctomycetota bacterium]